jgi:hypothetical protein
MLTPFERMLTYYAAQEVQCAVRFDPASGYYRTVDGDEVWAPTENSAQAFDLAVDLGMEVQPLEWMVMAAAESVIARSSKPRQVTGLMTGR